MPLLCSGQSDRGLVRKTNQDSILMNPVHKCFVVADGMGGHLGGDIASQLAVQIFSEELENMGTGHSTKIDVVKSSILNANKIIFEKSQKEEHLQGMGTTVVCLLIEKSKAYLANVGDSRGYLINNGAIYQLTRDHSLVQEKLNLGIYTRVEAALDRMKNILVRTLGFDLQVEIDIFEYTISKNDIFLICSDGLYGKVSDEEILSLINKHIPEPEIAKTKDLDLVIQELIAHANKYGGNDNISAIIALAQTK
jgi:serine/threonine protein phosphatase PrpC